MKRFAVSWPLGIKRFLSEKRSKALRSSQRLGTSPTNEALLAYRGKRFGLNAASPISIKGKAPLVKRFGLLDQKEALPFRAGMTKRFGFLTVQKVALREHWPVLGREALHRFLSSENEALPASGQWAGLPQAKRFVPNPGPAIPQAKRFD